MNSGEMVVKCKRFLRGSIQFLQLLQIKKKSLVWGSLKGYCAKTYVLLNSGKWIALAGEKNLDYE